MKLDPKLILGIAIAVTIGFIVSGIVKAKFGDKLGMDSYEED